MSRLKARVDEIESRRPALPIKIVWMARDGSPGFYHNSAASGTIIGEDELEMLALSNTLIKVEYNDKAERITKEDEDELHN
jgi:hypothetical protein